MLGSLFGFGMWMILARFQRRDIMLVLMAMLYQLHMFVRYLIANGSKCFRDLMFMALSPVRLLVMLFEMANSS